VRVTSECYCCAVARSQGEFGRKLGFCPDGLLHEVRAHTRRTAAEKQHFHIRLQLPVVIVGAVAQLMLVFEVLAWPSWNIPDRELFQLKLWGQVVLVPFLLRRSRGTTA